MHIFRRCREKKSPTRTQVIDAIETLKQVPFIDIQRLGYHFQVNDYYSPLNDCDFLLDNKDLWKNSDLPAEIDWNLEGQMKVAETVGRYVDELKDIPQNHPADKLCYCWDNPFWNHSDALVQYGLLREYKPQRVIEIGCGWSSMLMKQALDINGTPCEVTLIEPHPNQEIFKILPREWKHHTCILQRTPIDIFKHLQAGDVCFYDGSHCVKTASDVNWFFFKILPLLAPEVIIHIHDIILPDDYPDEWIFKNGQTWNEQYLLQAFLMYNRNYEILIANRYLWREKEVFLDEIYKGIQPSYGVSFWMKKLKSV
ncbi:MAG: class I SAM-dependent methyltransferase [Planctomycetota bacterium]